MSGIPEPSAIITGLEPFTLAPTVSETPAPQPHLDQQIPGGAAIVTTPMNLNSPDQKRKRGRPRKYGPDGSIAPSLPSGQPGVGTPTFSPPLVAPPSYPHTAGVGSVSPAVKKRRGRPPGSSNKKSRIESLGSTGIGFTPHVIDVKAGQDIASAIMALSQSGPRAICVLSATGIVSSVALRQTSSSCGAIHEGRFNILLLSGFYLPSNVNGQISRTGGLTVTLTGSDGRVLGGCVAGALTAASPVQVIVGSFIAEGKKDSRPRHFTDQSPPPMAGPVAAGGECSGGGANAYDNSHSQGVPGLPWK